MKDFDWTFDFGPLPTPEQVADAARIINEDFQKVLGLSESGEFWGSTYISGRSQVDASLTIEKIQEVINQIGSTIVETYERAPAWFGISRLPFPASAIGIPIHTSIYLGETVYPQPPAMDPGPYYKRRIKRWCRRHPPYTKGNGQYWIMNGGQEIWCHPDDLTTLQQEIAKYPPGGQTGGLL